MKESSLWAYIRKGMEGRWLPTRIESSSGNGVPDVAFAISRNHGWLELKYIPEWPKRTSTPVKLPLRPEQKLWILTRGKLAGNIWVLCRIGSSFFLLDWKEAIEATEGWLPEQWYSARHWLNRINFDQLYKEITNYETE